MNNKHLKNKKALKIVGFCTLIPGIVLTVTGFLSFTNAFVEGGFPWLFSLSFIGMILIGIGSMALQFGYRKELTNYIKNESVPVAKDLYQDLKPELNDFATTMRGEKQENYITCPKCGNKNKDTNKFCDECGFELVKKCPSCNATLESDSKFCPNCGKKLD